MYEQHFGLAKPPFRITPDPEFFFPGGNRGAVLEALVYAISRGEGIVKVVGEVGSGKTMLCRMLERELPEHCDIVYLANPRLAPSEILHAIAFELGLDCAAGDSKLQVLHALQDHLLEKHAAGVRVIMFVEEAQGMPVPTLEEIRMLSNLETTRDKLLQIVLFGQPELDEKLALHEIRQLRERITHAFELAPLDTDEIRDYVTTRLRTSGYRGNGLFGAGACRELQRHSSGLLRRINVLADKALLAAFADGQASVGPAHVRRAARDSEFGASYRPAGGRGEASGWLPALALLLLAGVLLAAWLSGARDVVPTAGDDAGAEVAAPAPAGGGRAAADGSAAAATEARDELRAPVTDPGTEPPALPTTASAPPPGFDDNRPVLPRIDPETGMVTLDHLAPLGVGGGASLSAP